MKGTEKGTIVNIFVARSGMWIARGKMDVSISEVRKPAEFELIMMRIWHQKENENE